MKLQKKLMAKIVIGSSLLLGTILCTSIITTSCSNANENNNSSTGTANLNFTQGTLEEMRNAMGVTEITPDRTFYSIDGGKTAVEYGNASLDFAKIQELVNEITAKLTSIVKEMITNPNVEPDFTEINNLSKKLQTIGYYKNVKKYFVAYSYYDKQSLTPGNNKIMYAIENV